MYKSVFVRFFYEAAAMTSRRGLYEKTDSRDRDKAGLYSDSMILNREKNIIKGDFDGTVDFFWRL